MKLFTWFVPEDHGVTPGHTSTLSDLSQLSQSETKRDPGGTLAMPDSLAEPVCLACATLSDREVM